MRSAVCLTTSTCCWMRCKFSRASLSRLQTWTKLCKKKSKFNVFSDLDRFWKAQTRARLWLKFDIICDSAALDKITSFAWSAGWSINCAPTAHLLRINWLLNMSHKMCLDFYAESAHHFSQRSSAVGENKGKGSNLIRMLLRLVDAIISRSCLTVQAKIALFN